MFHLLLAESALELVPDQIRGHPAVRNNADRSSRKPKAEILDGTFHHSAMRRLEDCERRGRPDMVHMTLLVAQGSILNREGHLRTYVHTQNDELIEVDPSTRLPRNLERFKGVISQLFLKGELKAAPDGEGKEGLELLKITRDMTVEKILKKIGPDRIYALEDGKSLNSFAAILKEDGLGPKELASSNIALIVGGFPHGDFKTDLSKMADKTFSIYGTALEIWTVVATVLSDAERALGLHHQI
jgi:rRNA small subunit pseudouridine methyltransferase Nep1